MAVASMTTYKIGLIWRHMKTLYIYIYIYRYFYFLVCAVSNSPINVHYGICDVQIWTSLHNEFIANSFTALYVHSKTISIDVLELTKQFINILHFNIKYKIEWAFHRHYSWRGWRDMRYIPRSWQICLFFPLLLLSHFLEILVLYLPISDQKSPPLKHRPYHLLKVMRLLLISWCWKSLAALMMPLSYCLNVS